LGWQDQKKISLRSEKGVLVNFASFQLNHRIESGVEDLGYTEPTSIQSHSIPSILQGRDFMGMAQTGTGKSAAFALPILQHLLSGPRKAVRALIIEPTRELAEQKSSWPALGVGHFESRQGVADFRALRPL
jgi:superfamily II DNA/RNA helicase